MAFFGSKSYERVLRRSNSTDRLRRERTRKTSAATEASRRADSIAVAQLQMQSQSQSQAQSHYTLRSRKAGVDEFGVVASSSSSSSRKVDPPSLTFSSSTGSAVSATSSIPNEPVTPVASPSLSVPVSLSVNSKRDSPSSSSSSLNKRPSSASRMRTVSASGSANGSTHGSKHLSSQSSNSKDPSRRRTAHLEAVDGRSGARARTYSASSGGKRSDAKVQQTATTTVLKSRSRTSLREREQIVAAGDGSDSVNQHSPKTPTRPPRGVQPPENALDPSPSPSFKATSASVSSSSSKTQTRTQTQNRNTSVTHLSRSASASASASSSSLALPLTNGGGPSHTGLPIRQHSASAIGSAVVIRHPTANASNNDDSSLSIPSKSQSNPNNSVSKKSSAAAGGGNASDSSYGSPFAEFGVVGSFSVKSLLSKPAAASGSSICGSVSGAGAGAGSGSGVRSEPDTSANSYESYGLAARRRRVEGRSNVPETPSSVYSVTTTTSLSLREREREFLLHKPTTSDPETPRDALGSLGRARGLEWGHVLNREREKGGEREKEKERGSKVHIRESSGASYSLSSPSEGGAATGVGGYPYGLAQERRSNNKNIHPHPHTNTKPVIQLTTSAVRRLSALGVREYDRERSRSGSRSPATPMTFGPSPSPVPSPLSGGSSGNVSARNASATARTGSGGGGRGSGQPSPTTNTNTNASAGASVVRRAESPKPPVGLTPAEIVAHQYKQQERRRAELEREMARDAQVPERVQVNTSTKAADLQPSLHDRNSDLDLDYNTVRAQEKEKDKEKERARNKKPSLLFRRSSANVMPSPTSPVVSVSKSSNYKSDGEPPTPYYTVFGGPTGRVVAIGSARDSAFGLFDRAQERKAKAIVAEISSTTGAAAAAGTGMGSTGLSDASGSEEKTRTLRRKLSRKMSGKIRRDGSVSVVLARADGGSGGSVSRGRESGKDTSDGPREKTKTRTTEFGETVAAGRSADVDWLTYGTEGHLRTRPSLTLNTSSAATTNTTTTPSLASAPLGGGGNTNSRRSATLPREKSSAAPAVKMSMDSFVAVQSVDSTSGRALPSAVNGALPSASAIPKIGRLKDEKDREKEKGKLWGLMRRISSNALKDKYKRTSTEAVPPVPALPRENPSSSSSYAWPTTVNDDEKPNSAEKNGACTDASCAAVHLATPPSSRPPSRRPSTAPVVNLNDLGTKDGRFVTLRKRPSIGQVQDQFLETSPLQTSSASRPSVLTRSPSPFSSDMAFSYNQSEGSPVTSYGDVVSTNGGKLSRDHWVLGEHILPPETLYMFDDVKLDFDDRKEDDVRSKPSLRSPTVDVYDNLFYSEEPTCPQALPAPPRRTPQAKADEDMDECFSESPTIPSFSADNAINTFGLRKRAATSAADSVASVFTGVDFGTGSASTTQSSPPSVSSAASIKGTSEPPPRPPRSARRGPPPGTGTSRSSSSNASAHPSSDSSLHSSSSSLPIARTTTLEDRAARASIGAHSQASTARPNPNPNPNVHHHHPSSSSSLSPYSTPSPPPPPELLDSQSPVSASASDSASSTMTFRDMSGLGAKKSSGLTEKEKVDKWNDLLDRSEKAGGTLHVGVGDALLSDQIRESAYEPTIRDSVYSDY